MKRIGIMGGTFDPIHNAHLLIAEQAREKAKLDEVWFMPAHIPPHKQQKKSVANATHRAEMVRLAIRKHPQFRITMVELDREGPSYTADTMQQLVALHPDCQFNFIIGGDMVEMLPQWYAIEELVRLVRFIGFHRPQAAPQPSKWTTYVDFIEIPLWELSSTYIREQVQIGKSIRYLVPSAVECYIKESGLYGADPT
ncbi:nicotinate-nucleotide adenylyltransferase [Brevibacillus laterosporus]|uniref:Probable nicotinate-nucleotide adenylyltransferase n=1 Tax=Brevibacillus laterosporus TaxID=1465 RepID=A0A502HI49_BRELA|nr:nicotinate-nucleotide adenylyltransferase [Brevibacillus laterosporus]QDX93208.1 nicotinate-nucleotide adenylyltransferase [Brevibacillus laterosporus]TPG72948.1 nicotinate-nucleotide adenylyltransferase [Brevibacillus laterosporus]TPG86905.1 nicotinate-nucleotide adenylyltransferase [Brevibacillus laterosporus]